MPAPDAPIDGAGLHIERIDRAKEALWQVHAKVATPAEAAELLRQVESLRRVVRAHEADIASWTLPNQPADRLAERGPPEQPEPCPPCGLIAASPPAARAAPAGARNDLDIVSASMGAAQTATGTLPPPRGPHTTSAPSALGPAGRDALPGEAVRDGSHEKSRSLWRDRPLAPRPRRAAAAPQKLKTISARTRQRRWRPNKAAQVPRRRPHLSRNPYVRCQGVVETRSGHPTP
jgi:hypothetical protein